jgi:predicted SAM-dependent methyltransferase
MELRYKVRNDRDIGRILDVSIAGRERQPDRFALSDPKRSKSFSLPYAGNSLKRINLHHVIEHLPYQQELVAECYRAMMYSGRINISTLNMQSLYYYINPPDRERHGQHLELFGMHNIKTLRNMVELAGFITIDVYFAPGNWPFRNRLYAIAVK